MWEVSAPAARRPVLRGGALTLSALLLTAACETAEAPARSAHAGEPGAAATASEAPSEAVDVACELAAWVADDALGVAVEAAEAPPSDLLEEEDENGCRLTAVGSFADLPEDVETPVDLLWETFDEGGWHEDPRYAADTEESSTVGMWKSGVLCVMGALWTPADAFGYDHDHEPTEEEMRYDVTIECVSAGAPPIPFSGSMA
jgi:hypothetical protein